MNTIRRKQWLVTGTVIAGLFLLLFLPFDTTVVPEWKIRVVDETSKPLPNLAVREQWRNHSVEFYGHNEERMTDGEGFVSFPRRTVRASLIFRVVGRAVVALNVHGESGPKASVLVMGRYSSLTNSEYSPEERLPETVVVKAIY